VRFLTWLLTNAIALAIAAALFDGISFGGPDQGQAEITEKLLPLLLVALILGAVTSFVKPVLQILSIPLILLTLGLFLLVINALMLMFTGWLAGVLGIGFQVDGFWTAVGGSIVITLATWALDGLIGDRSR
jgi:putative membrane protein